jgi:AN1-like Zinc finger
MARCVICRKRVPELVATILRCKCEKIVCAKHRLASLHDCTHDYRKEQQDKLEATLATVKVPKVNKI